MFFVAIGLGSNLYSVYQPYIIVQNGFTNTQAAWIVTTRSLFIVLGMFTAGWLCARLGIRSTVTAAMLLMALSRFQFGAARTLPAYLAAAAVTGLAYSWGGMIPLSLLINRWFQDAFWAEAAFVAAASAAVHLLVRDDPARLGLEPYRKTGDREPDRTPVLHPAPAGMTPLYWGLFLAAVFLIGAPTGIGISNIGVLFVTEGFDAATVALLVSCVGLAMIPGKMIYGELADRLGCRCCPTRCSVCPAAAASRRPSPPFSPLDWGSPSAMSPSPCGARTFWGTAALPKG